MRINRYLALQGVATRKGADELIEKKKVRINGRIAVLGDKVNEGDEVKVDNSKPKKYRYFAYNKPKGVVTHSPQDFETDIMQELKGIKEVEGTFPVGRLDKDSYGLIVLTDDGRVTARLLSPEHEHDKEYVVKTSRELRPSFKENIEAGIDIGDYVTKPCKIKILGDKAFAITLTEGKRHQIRRMVVALHNDVVDLRRTRVLNIHLGKLGSGQLRAIEGTELKTFLKSINLPAHA